MDGVTDTAAQPTSDAAEPDAASPDPGTPGVDRARALVDDLLAGAPASDDPARGVSRQTLRRLADAGLYSVAVPTELGGLGGDEDAHGAVEEVLAGADGATWFVLTQHRMPQGLTLRPFPGQGPAAERHRDALARGERIAGIAVAHLRRPGHQVQAEPDGDGWRFTGRSDWCTGWGLVDLVLVAATTHDDRVVFALIDATRRDGLTASDPLRLSVMGGTRTVALDLDAMPVAAGEVAAVVPAAAWRERDANTVLDTKPGVLGLLARVITETDRVGRERDRPLAVEAAALLGAEAAPLRARAVALRGDADHAAERVRLRGELAELTVRAAAGLVAARGGSAMLAEHHEGRWWREAGFHLVQAQTDAVRAAQLAAIGRGRARSTG